MRICKYVVCFIFIVLMLTGCSAPEMKDSYTLGEIYKDEVYGFFVKDGDTFYPVKFINKDRITGYQWYVGEINFPKVSEKTPLVAVFNVNSNMPDEYYIEKYNDIGYSIGANISIGEDNNSLWLNTQSLCSGSDANSVLPGLKLDSDTEIEAINKSMPFQNIDTDINILTGLEKNKYYDFQIYSGTRSTNVELCADTRILKLKEKTEIPNALTKTHEQYFLVNLPSNLESGYYDVNGEGLFQIGK